MARYGTPTSNSEKQSKRTVEYYIGIEAALDIHALQQEFTNESGGSPWFDVRQVLNESLGAVANRGCLADCIKLRLHEMYPPEDFLNF